MPDIKDEPEKIAEVEAKYIDANCPKCKAKINKPATLEKVGDEVYFAGYNLKCDECGYEFYHKLY